jgi:hypothetical protein
VRSGRSRGGEEEAMRLAAVWAWGSMQGRRWTSHRLQASLSIGLGRSMGFGDVQPREVSPSPHLLYVACATGGHQPCVAEHPRSGRGQGFRVGRWANSVEIYSNILPLDLNLSFNFKLWL